MQVDSFGKKPPSLQGARSVIEVIPEGRSNDMVVTHMDMSIDDCGRERMRAPGGWIGA